MGLLMTGVRLTKRGFLATLILYFSFLTWYFILSVYVPRNLVGLPDEKQLIVSAFFNFIIVITLLVTSFFIHRFNKFHSISICSILTTITITTLLFTSNIILELAIFFLAGIFFSIGQLASFVYFWNLTVPEERGRVSGLIGLLALPPFYFVTFLMAETLDLSGIVILSIIFSLGALITELEKPEKKAILAKNEEKKRHYPEKKTILLYSIPWILYSLINTTFGTTISLHISQQVSFSSYIFLTSLQLITAVVGALGGGIISDFLGRRQCLIFTLTLYGVSSALAGLFTDYIVYYVVYTTSGLNWGILMTLYLLVIWGDLASKENSAKLYSIGLTVFYLSNAVGNLISYQISQISLVLSSLVSCLLIFLSNIPLLLAPELLDSAFREKIKMKLHMSTIKKIKRKQLENQG